MVTIKNLPANRWEEYRSLRLEALRSDPLAFGSSYLEEKKLKEGEWKRRIRNTLFALEDDKPVGMVGYLFGRKIKRRHVADIFGVYVKSKYRGRGIGKELLLCVLKTIAKNKKIVKIKLTVNTEQTAAIKLYEKTGFIVVGRLKKDLKINGKFFDGFIMEKLL